MANTFGEKELKTSWDEHGEPDNNKTLIPEKSFVPQRYRVGLD